MQNYGEKSHIFTITELARSARFLMESHFQNIWVSGEISNFVCPASGHWYFSLKDETAQIRCAMFRMHNQKLKFTPEHGMQVIARVKASIYENRGDFQLIVEQLEETGLGALQRAFEQLKAKLSQEGLFDATHKKALPRYPTRIGVVTSPTGAAIRDILSVLKRRYPIADVLIYPTLVQGERAAEQIVQGIQLANRHAACDVLLVARGGGSLEDLWPFNEESVARAVFQSDIPIISGVGHEIDFTISDFVADHRTPTPSAAAELASPDLEALPAQLTETQRRLQTPVMQILQRHQQTLDWLGNRLKQCHPARVFQDCQQQLQQLTDRLKINITSRLDQDRQKLQLLSRTLHAVSPLTTLERGYTILTDSANQVIRDSRQVQPKDQITAQLSTGKLLCEVVEVNQDIALSP